MEVGGQGGEAPMGFLAIRTPPTPKAPGSVYVTLVPKNACEQRHFVLVVLLLQAVQKSTCAADV